MQRPQPYAWTCGLLILAAGHATLAATPLGNAFTYQGYLEDLGAPANGPYDFEFKLYDAVSGGSQAGSTIPVDDISISGGYFTVTLDFGPVFDGTAYWLRHTYAQNLLEAGAKLFEIKEMLGHDSIESTGKYLSIHTALMRKVLFDEAL